MANVIRSQADLLLLLDDAAPVDAESQLALPTPLFDPDERALLRDLAVSTLNIGPGQSQVTVGVNGAAAALTALPLGYLKTVINGVAVVIPYYNQV